MKHSTDQSALPTSMSLEQAKLRRPIRAGTSIKDINDATLDAYCAVDTYGDFTLGKGIRPSYDLSVIPAQGFTYEIADFDNDSAVPSIYASASREHLLRLFLDLSEPIRYSPNAQVLIDTSRTDSLASRVELTGISGSKLETACSEFETLILDDGFFGMSIVNESGNTGVALDEHNVLFAYGVDLSSYVRTLQDYNVHQDNAMRYISEAEHLHISDENHAVRAKEFIDRLTQ